MLLIMFLLILKICILMGLSLLLNLLEMYKFLFWLNHASCILMDYIYDGSGVVVEWWMMNEWHYENDQRPLFL